MAEVSALTERIERANYTTLAAAEREAKLWWRTLAILEFLLLAATIAGGLLVFLTLSRPFFVHTGPGLLTSEPSVLDEQFVAWESAQAIIAPRSATVAADLDQSKRWMTDEAVEELNRALAEFERTNKVSYEQSVAAAGLSTSIDELTSESEPAVGAGASKRYRVVFRGQKTTLTKRNVPIETRPFAMRVYLVRVAEDEGNPHGLLATRFERLGDIAPGAASDTPLASVEGAKVK